MASAGTKHQPRAGRPRRTLEPWLAPEPLASARSWPWLVIPALWLAAAASLVIDLPVARFWRDHKTPGFIVDALESAEAFGNGAGVILLLAGAYFLGALQGRTLPRLALASLGAGLVADAFKLIIARTRPRDSSLAEGVLATFGDWLPSVTAESSMQGFPSAHVATAVGLAFALSYFHPRGRWVFGTFAVMVLLQRVQTGAHFLSDTLAGAAVGWGTAVVLFRLPGLRTWFERFESPRPSVSPLPESAA